MLKLRCLLDILVEMSRRQLKKCIWISREKSALEICIGEWSAYCDSCSVMSMGCSLLGFSVHGILQARILEWVAIPISRGSSQPRGWIQVSCIASRFFYCLSHQGSPSILTIFKSPKLDQLSEGENWVEKRTGQCWELRERRNNHQRRLKRSRRWNGKKVWDLRMSWEPSEECISMRESWIMSKVVKMNCDTWPLVTVMWTH